MSASTPSPQSPALRPQHNGWSARRQQRFLDHLASHGSVAAAARHVGMSRQSAYWLRRQPCGADFARSWDAAVAEVERWIVDMAMDRMLDGEEEVVERDGVTMAVRRRPCDARLLLFHLKRMERREVAAAAVAAAEAAVARNRYESSQVSKLRAELWALAMGEDVPDGDAAPDPNQNGHGQSDHHR